MSALVPLDLRNVTLRDQFWNGRIAVARDISIDYMWKALNDQIPDIPPSSCIKNLRIAAGLEDGEFHGYRFQDSDLYKWLEAVAYSLETSPDPELESLAEGAIELIESAQQPNGYIDTYITLNDIEPWTDTWRAHELYCAGHMFEAAAAYKSATGSGRFLAVARRLADHICSVFGPEPHKKKGYPGHQEIEVGLFKLYRVTDDKKYLDLAKFFLDARGQRPYYYDREQDDRVSAGGERVEYYRDHGPIPFSYQQAHLPVREQTEAVGHAVRCVYMSAGMADVGGETDPTLLDAARRLYRNIVDTQMYVTGGIGSMIDGEAFTFPYDLPNDRMYTETCASIGLMMASERLLNLDCSAEYADVCERALYNNLLAGMSLDGRSFFYVNPMEMWPERSLRRHDMREVLPERQGWYGCACCPPNLLRTLLGLGRYIYSRGESDLYVNLFIASSADFTVNGQKIRLVQDGNYPWDGRVTFTVESGAPAEFGLHIRIPSWCRGASLTVNGEAADAHGPVRNGFLTVRRTFAPGTVIALDMPIKPRLIYCDDRVPYNAGKAAVARGPLIYCTEEADNGGKLWNLSVDPGAPIREEPLPGIPGGVVSLKAAGLRRSLRGDALYTDLAPSAEPAEITLVPYYAWGNRGSGEMSVWQNVGG